MSITVIIPPILYQYTGDKQAAIVEGNTVGQCLDHLIKQFPGIEEALFDKDGELKYWLNIYVNRESSYPEELVKPVKDGDEIQIIPVIVGG
ncbi:MoaD/ThiS family protein [Chloroflexota bacterium]